MKKQVAMALATVMAVTGLTACGSGAEAPSPESAVTTESAEEVAESTEETEEKQEASENAGPVTLELWSGFTSTDGDIMQDIFDKFNEENEWGITIKMDLMAWDTIDEKLPAAIAAGGA